MLTKSIPLVHYNDLSLSCRNPQYSLQKFRDYFVNAPNQWEVMLHCNIVSHWLGAIAKWSLKIVSYRDRNSHCGVETVWWQSPIQVLYWYETIWKLNCAPEDIDKYKPTMSDIVLCVYYYTLSGWGGLPFGCWHCLIWIMINHQVCLASLFVP